MNLLRILLALVLVFANVQAWPCDGKMAPDGESTFASAPATGAASHHDHASSDDRHNGQSGNSAEDEHECCAAPSGSSSCPVTHGCGHVGGSSLVATPDGSTPAASAGETDLGRFASALSLRHASPPFRPPTI